MRLPARRRSLIAKLAGSGEIGLGELSLPEFGTDVAAAVVGVGALADADDLVEIRSAGPAATGRARAVR